MRAILRWLYLSEVVLAIRLGAAADWWASRATRRLGKLSVWFPEVEE